MTARGRKTLIAVMIALSAAVIIGGGIWTVTQAVRDAGFVKVSATVTACETGDLDGSDVTVKVLVSYERDGKNYENASYIGDLGRCKVGMTMNVYVQKNGTGEYVFSKSSDLGFALIMMCGGLLWLGISIVYAVCAYRAGYLDKNEEN